jgi:23S rRNA pseudouridine2604 synthase
MEEKEEASATRINKYLSEIGFCSRRAADRMIEQGLVLVNGVAPEPGLKVFPDDEITVDGEKVKENKKPSVYLALNKPRGIVCTTDTKREKNNIIDFVNYPTRIFPIGRLDKMSEGLILLTDDGDIVNKILRARNNHEKEYLVTVDRPYSQRFLKKMANGVPILDTVTKKCLVEPVNQQTFRIVLTQGLNRQIRRMCEFLGYKVIKLKRIRIMNITLDIEEGKYRHLTEAELKKLDQLTAGSQKAV